MPRKKYKPEEIVSLLWQVKLVVGISNQPAALH